jgi:hypothetical protein
VVVRGEDSRRRTFWGAALLMVALSLAVAGTAGAADPMLNLWPVYESRTDPVDQTRVQGGLGPLLLSGRSLDGTTEETAFRPFFFYREDKSRDSAEWDALYPLMGYRRSEKDWEFHFLHLLSLRGEGSDPADREERGDFFPFYFSGTTAEGERYHALFPFYGHVKDRLFQDEAEFVLFPLYARFTKQGRVATWFPWPFLAHIGGTSTGFTLFPLYAQEEKPGVLERGYALWPLVLWQRTGLESGTPSTTLAVLPFYVEQRSPESDRFQVLWPFFAYTRNRERHFEEWDAPWPFLKIARGAGRNITRVFPLFGVEDRVLRNEFLLREVKYHDWYLAYPLYIRNEEQYLDGRKVRDRVLFWLYSDQREEGRDGSTRRVDAWPFLRYERDREGNEIFQTLALLEAFAPGDERLERSYSPLWSIYSYRRNPAGSAVHSFLWNFVRHEETALGRSVEVLGPVLRYQEAEGQSAFSLFGGLVAWESQEGRRTLRILGTSIFSWEETPQAMATIETTGGQP